MEKLKVFITKNWQREGIREIEATRLNNHSVKAGIVYYSKPSWHNTLEDAEKHLSSLKSYNKQK